MAHGRHGLLDKGCTYTSQRMHACDRAVGGVGATRFVTVHFICSSKSQRALAIT